MISIVIPVYNEAENIFPLYEKLKKVVEKIGAHEIIFVDDGSTDDTYHKIKKLREKDKNVKCIKFRRNFGQTPALKAGFDMARGEIVITMDGDLQNDPEDIPKLIEKLDKYDVVSGWRYDRKDGLGKKLASKISNWLARRLTGLQIHDFGCTLKAYKRECLENLELYGEMHRYIPALIAWRGFKVGEMKVRHNKRKYGKSKYGLSRLLKGFFDLINFKFMASYSTRPLHFFGIVGLSVFSLGVLINLYLLFLKIFYGERLSSRPLLLLGVLLIIIGFQIFLTGFVAEMVLRTGDMNKKIYVIEEKLE